MVSPLKHEVRMPSGYIKHSMKQVKIFFLMKRFYEIFIFIYLYRSDGSYYERSYKTGEMSWKIKFHIFREPATTCCTTEQHVANNARECPLNFVQVDRHTVFSDSANILERSPSGLRTQGCTPMKRLIRNSWLGKQ